MALSAYTKLKWNLPWLVRYPFWRAVEKMGRLGSTDRESHIILVVANHFEPGYNEIPNEKGGKGIQLDWDTQMRRVDSWYKKAQAIGEAVRDHDGTPFRHTNFYPIEQYNRRILDRMAEMQDAGFGEVEIHLHHGVGQPDTEDNLRRTLETYRDIFANEHKCLSKESEDDIPRYAFVHGNLALANSADGWCCGVDSEMQILADTGCYADLTLPSAPDRTQVPRINAIYECGGPFNERRPHRTGPSLKVGRAPKLPVIMGGPLVFDWGRRKHGLPFPRIENGALTTNYLTDLARLDRWVSARISVSGRPDWTFVKLYCHGFFEYDQPATIGESMRASLQEILEFAERSGKFKLHFASAREAFNIAMAAVEGRQGNPGQYRDYKLNQIMRIESLQPERLEVGRT